MGVRYRQRTSFAAGVSSSYTVAVSPVSAMLPPSSRGISRDLSESNDIDILSDSISTPTNVPVVAIVPVEASSEGENEGSPSASVSSKHKRKIDQ
ncbi:UNVERIFIED_CONTAM: hypothetical protein Slati_1491800 [Sesamum latifolium]|uniref:Uncharacterized protein n=1 Tax=Sesamum latifolium TaxID=2727402 RepID=A0AAW2X826_9LAMI